MKLEVGQHARTEDGYIAKVEAIKCNEEGEQIWIFEKGYTQEDWDYINNHIWVDSIKSASNNIIDIIEVGDIVNGRLVKETYKGAILTSGKIIFDREQEQIKSILTHEQYERMAYKIN